MGITEALTALADRTANVPYTGHNGAGDSHVKDSKIIAGQRVIVYRRWDGLVTFEVYSTGTRPLTLIEAAEVLAG